MINSNSLSWSLKCIVFNAKWRINTRPYRYSRVKSPLTMRYWLWSISTDRMLRIGPTKLMKSLGKMRFSLCKWRESRETIRKRTRRGRCCSSWTLCISSNRDSRSTWRTSGKKWYVSSVAKHSNRKEGCLWFWKGVSTRYARNVRLSAMLATPKCIVCSAGRKETWRKCQRRWANGWYCKVRKRR